MITLAVYNVVCIQIYVVFSNIHEWCGYGSPKLFSDLKWIHLLIFGNHNGQIMNNVQEKDITCTVDTDY